MGARLVSLDVFRGLTIALMVLVNAQDEEIAYWPLVHPAWNGWTPTDLVFPFFLFIVGVSMTFSFAARLDRGDSRGEILKHTLRRGAILFLIGVVLHVVPHVYRGVGVRYAGVLQRIAICAVVTAALVLWTSWRTQALVVLACLAGYWAALRFIPVPGYGTPTVDVPLLDPDGNLTAWLDRQFLPGRLYEETRDPEGILSTIPSVATTLLGALTGAWLRGRRSPVSKAIGMAAAGVLGLALGQILSVWLPLNKKMWTSSFAVFMAGFALVVLAFCYWAVDIRKWRGRVLDPILAFGMNAIAAYVLAESVSIAIEMFPFGGRGGDTLKELVIEHHLMEGAGLSAADASLVWSLGFVLLIWLAMWALQRKKIFFRI
jgi:predicted acyltransferase